LTWYGEECGSRKKVDETKACMREEALADAGKQQQQMATQTPLRPYYADTKVFYYSGVALLKP
jgi:hypothetical protein